MDLSFQIVYSRRKTVAMSVERDASVIVRAPEGMAKEKIHRLIEAKRFWLYQKINHDQKYPLRQTRKEFRFRRDYPLPRAQLSVADHE